jgi:hypothetical protein
MAWLASVFGGNVLSSLFGLGTKALDYYVAKANGNVQEAIALMQADQARLAAQKDITLAGMNHPLWWAVWLMFVAPLGVYWSKVIIWDKVLGWGYTDPLTGFVLDWSGYIVLSLFGLQVGVGVVGGILNRVLK